MLSELKSTFEEVSSDRVGKRWPMLRDGTTLLDMATWHVEGAPAWFVQAGFYSVRDLWTAIDASTDKNSENVRRLRCLSPLPWSDKVDSCLRELYKIFEQGGYEGVRNHFAKNGKPWPVVLCDPRPEPEYGPDDENMAPVPSPDIRSLKDPKVMRQVKFEEEVDDSADRANYLRVCNWLTGKREGKYVDYILPFAEAFEEMDACDCPPWEEWQLAFRRAIGASGVDKKKRIDKRLFRAVREAWDQENAKKKKTTKNDRSPDVSPRGASSSSISPVTAWKPVSIQPVNGTTVPVVPPGLCLPLDILRTATEGLNASTHSVAPAVISTPSLDGPQGASAFGPEMLQQACKSLTSSTRSVSVLDLSDSKAQDPSVPSPPPNPGPKGLRTKISNEDADRRLRLMLHEGLVYSYGARMAKPWEHWVVRPAFSLNVSLLAVAVSSAMMGLRHYFRPISHYWFGIVVDRQEWSTASLAGVVFSSVVAAQVALWWHMPRLPTHVLRIVPPKPGTQLLEDDMRPDAISVGGVKHTRKLVDAVLTTCEGWVSRSRDLIVDAETISQMNHPALLQDTQQSESVFQERMVKTLTGLHSVNSDRYDWAAKCDIAGDTKSAALVIWNCRRERNGLNSKSLVRQIVGSSMDIVRGSVQSCVSYARRNPAQLAVFATTIIVPTTLSVLQWVGVSRVLSSNAQTPQTPQQLLQECASGSLSKLQTWIQTCSSGFEPSCGPGSTRTSGHFDQILTLLSNHGW